jgi:hypothetical protein
VSIAINRWWPYFHKVSNLIAQRISLAQKKTKVPCKISFKLGDIITTLKPEKPVNRKNQTKAQQYRHVPSTPQVGQDHLYQNSG